MTVHAAEAEAECTCYLPKGSREDESLDFGDRFGQRHLLQRQNFHRQRYHHYRTATCVFEEAFQPFAAGIRDLTLNQQRIGITPDQRHERRIFPPEEPIAVSVQLLDGDS